MATNVNSAVQNRVHCAKLLVHLRKQISLLKLFPVSELPKFVAINILGPLPKSQRGFQFSIGIIERFTKLVEVVLLRLICSAYVAQAFSKHWGCKYGPPKTLHSDNENLCTSKFFQIIRQLLEIVSLITSTYHPQTNEQVE